MAKNKKIYHSRVDSQVSKNDTKAHYPPKRESFWSVFKRVCTISLNGCILWKNEESQKKKSTFKGKFSESPRAPYGSLASARNGLASKIFDLFIYITIYGRYNNRLFTLISSMLSLEEAGQFPFAQGRISFMNKKDNRWAIRYGDKWYPFDQGDYIGGMSTFDSLEEGDVVYFPLAPNYIRCHGTLPNIMPTKTTVNEILLDQWLGLREG